MCFSCNITTAQSRLLEIKFIQKIKFAFVHMAANSSVLCLVGVLIYSEWSTADNQRDNQRGSSAEAISQAHNQTIDASWKN